METEYIAARPIYSADHSPINRNSRAGISSCQEKSITAFDKDLNAWLHSVGLDFNPFTPLEAGADPRLSTYLVDHDVFPLLWGNWPTALFAPSGGGKSAFRVRLAYACRAGQDGRRIFPVVYPLPDGPLSLDEHLQIISRVAVQELLLELAWRPGWFEKLDTPARREIRRAFDWNAPGLLAHFLPQLRQAGSPAPAVEAFDPSAAHLPNPPTPARVRNLCEALQALPVTTEPAPPLNERFQHLLKVLLSILKREAIYLLIDGVDAYPETIKSPLTALTWLRPLVDQFSTWEVQKLYPKLFLPQELERNLKKSFARLTSQVKCAKIEWTSERLVELLRFRIQAASGGAFNSLDAISHPSLSQVERTLVAQVPPIPRELLVLTGRLLSEHVRRTGPIGLLEPEDLEAAIAFYKNQDAAPQTD